jgi:hypothetical protein
MYSILTRMMQLVNDEKIYVFGLTYPTVSPTLSQAWSGFYERGSSGTQIFSEPGEDFHSACKNLFKSISADLALVSSLQGEDLIDEQFHKTDVHISRLKEFIDECIVLGNTSWLLSLEFIIEGVGESKWCGLIDGYNQVPVQINECATSLEQVCIQLWENIKDHSGA